MSDQKEYYQLLKKYALDLKFDLFGVADLTGIQHEFHLNRSTSSRFSHALSCGKRLLDSVLEDIKDHPTALYFHHYRQINFFLDRGALLLSSFIQEHGYKSLPIPASQVIDWENQRGHVSHKKIGYLAGLGWIGRNNLLVNPRIGSRFRLVTILTDMPLLKDHPLKIDCGDCRDCLHVCPAKAIQEDTADFDHRACFEKLREFRKSGIVGQYICGICVKACSGNRLEQKL